MLTASVQPVAPVRSPGAPQTHPARALWKGAQPPKEALPSPLRPLVQSLAREALRREVRKGLS